MNASVTELLYVTREPAWALWAVQYFFLIGLSVGCFALTLPGLAFGRDRWREIGRMALIGALVCGLVAPVALLADLNQPGRFANFYLHPATGSWMAWGAFFIPAYVGALVLYAWAVLAPEFRTAAASGGPLAPVRRLFGGNVRPGLVRLFGLATLVGAALVALYTGIEVMVVHARPLWNTMLLPFQFLATAVAGAIGLTLIFERVFGAADADVERQLNRMLIGALVVVAGIGATWFALAFLRGGSSEARALAQVAGSTAWKTSALWLAAAVALPMVVAVVKPGGTGWVTGLLALDAAWMFRWTIFVGGQEIPKTGAGWYAHPLALGPEGLTGLVGTAGLWLAVLVVLTTLVPRSAPAAAAPRSTLHAGA